MFNTTSSDHPPAHTNAGIMSVDQINPGQAVYAQDEVSGGGGVDSGCARAD